MVPAFQPIVDLRDNSVAAYEALARWPRLPSTSTERVFSAARRSGWAAELDRDCLDTSLTVARAMPAAKPWTVLVNVEPENIWATSIGNSAAESGIDPLLAHDASVRVVVEIAERSLLAQPARLLRGVDDLRRRGLSIALDDVGVDPASLVLLPLIAPDVIKLDRSLLAENLDGDRLETLLAVLSYAERVDVAVVAEGIETDAQLARASAWGAGYGQGFLLGEPAPLPLPRTIGMPLSVRPPAPQSVAAVIDGCAQRTAPLSLLLSLMDQLLEFARTTSERLTIVMTFARPNACTESIALRLRSLADLHPYVEAIGAPADLFGSGDRVRVADSAEPHGEHGAIVVLGQRFYCALVARVLDADSDVADPLGDWAYHLTVDPDRTCAIAHTLIVHSRTELSDSPA
ncbi:EAL domain-containing protein [Rhodococcoides kroppenstedtii]|uniref:EAL domain-containing protein n=1 Tax=Rhodococcoides kroppenstedtii TaxID=293050 RepID=UPI00362ED45A